MRELILLVPPDVVCVDLYGHCPLDKDTEFISEEKVQIQWILLPPMTG
jgi:hypothetical protein